MYLSFIHQTKTIASAPQNDFIVSGVVHIVYSIRAILTNLFTKNMQTTERELRGLGKYPHREKWVQEGQYPPC